MLINLRNAMMAGKRLPYDAEVEYLESTGTQYIDIPVSVSAGQFFEVAGTISASNLVTNAMLFDANVSGQFHSSRYSESSSSIIFASSVGGVSSQGGWSITPNRMTAFALSTTGKTVDGVFAALARPLTSALSKIRIFGPIRSGFAFASVKFAAIKITVGNDVVFDGIPVRKGSTGYLYDRVSGALFGNAGTGDFVLGPDVVPVEWLETSGSQYINTGVTCGSADTTVFEFDQSYSALQSGRYIWGSNYGANQGKDADNYYVCGLNRSDVIMQTGVVYHCKTQIAPNNAIKAYINGTLFRDNTGSSPYTNPFYIFRLGGSNAGEGRPSHLRIHHLTVSVNNARVRSFHSIRVGTGSTWEGAMMDVLTRRIYRNAGTGAFTYGNDLKYPIPAS